MSPSPFTPAVVTAAGLALAWLVTYLLHSTVTLGGAWGLSRFVRSRRARGEKSGALLAVEESVWKMALVGALVTATLQVGWLAFAQPAPSAIRAGLESPALTTARTPAGAEAGQAARSAGIPMDGARSDSLGSADATTAATGAAASGEVAALLGSARAALPGWQRLLLSVWMLGAAGLMGLLAVAWMRLRRQLSGRREITTGALRESLDHLLARSAKRGQAASTASLQVRLTRTSELPVPVALGVGEREICVPRRALDGLEPRWSEALLAHELAHLLRRDPLWLLGARVIESVLFLQPLNRVARRRLQEIAELSADAWAVSQTGDRIGLARCLTEVADWLRGARRGRALPVTGVAAMAAREHGLAERVERILSGDAASADPRPRRWALAASGVALALTLLVPGLTPPRLEAADGVQEREQEEADQARALEREVEREVERRVHRERRVRVDGEDVDAEVDHHVDHDADFDVDPDFDFDVDVDFDFDFDLEDLDALGPEVELAVMQALAMAQGGEIHQIEAQVDMESALAHALVALESVDLGEVEVALLAHDHALEAAERALNSPEARREMSDEERAEARRELDEARVELRQERDAMRHELEEARQELEREKVRLREKMEVHRNLSQEDRERLRARSRELAERSRPSREEMERLRVEARRLAEQDRPNREELERLRVEARRLAEQNRPSRAEMERLRVEARRLAEQSRLSEEELRRLRDEARALAREHQEEMRQRREELLEQQEELRDRQEELREQERERENG